MDGGTDAWENAKWFAAIFSAFFAGVAGVLWNFILRVQDSIVTDQTAENKRIWDVITAQNVKAHDEAIEQERRFATKQDVQNLQLHMDKGHADINTRLDNITTLIINRPPSTH